MNVNAANGVCDYINYYPWQRTFFSSTVRDVLFVTRVLVVRHVRLVTAELATDMGKLPNMLQKQFTSIATQIGKWLVLHKNYGWLCK